MIFPFDVIKNGVCYPAGTEVPNRSEKRGDKPPVETPGKVDEQIDPIVEKTEEEPEKKVEKKKKGRKYTEKDLDLPYMKLKSLASKEGIKVDKSAKADEIKELLRTL